MAPTVGRFCELGRRTTMAKVLTLIADSRTIKDTYKLVGISDITLTRWRRCFPDFDADYLKAVEKQWMNLEATKKSGVKTYKRNVTKLREKPEKEAKNQKTEQEKQEARESGKLLIIDGLRVRYEYHRRPPTRTVYRLS